MKQISDKELDNLFKSNFEDFELKPSENSWNIIQEKLEGKSSKKKFSMNWLVAASVLFVLGIGWSFLNRDNDVVQLKGKAIPVLSENHQDIIPPVQENRVKQTESLKESSMEENKVQNEARFRAMLATSKTENRKNNKSAATIRPTSNVYIANTKSENQESNVNKGAEDLMLKKEQDPVVLAFENNNQEQDKFLAHHVQNDDELTDRASKIKSVGDLVNFVVGKIDKRPEKILHISKTEESDMEITGINLGLFKYRKN